MAKHLIIYGHGAGDPGAVGNGENERDFNRKKLHPYIKKWADKSKDTFVFFDTTGNRDMFQETAQGFGMYSIKAGQYTTINEFHEDAASAAATGGHVIVSSSFKADNVDLNTAQVIKKMVDWWGGVTNSRGISYRSNLLNLNVAAQRGLNYRLSELGFITSKRDMDIIRRSLDQYAKGIVESITGEKLGVVEVAKPKEKSPIVKEPHKPRQKVRSYWYSKGHPKLRELMIFCDRNKIFFELRNKGDYTLIEMRFFAQKSPSKDKLVKFLEDNKLNYDIKLEFYENV